LADLKEKGIVNFLRDYLRPIGPDGEMPSLRKLLLGLGFIPVCQSPVYHH
jgi:NAD-dependent histone deacetylase SIR2